MKIATKTGDKGKTSLFQGGRVQKSHHLIELVGEIDELSATIGMAKAIMPNKPTTGPDFSHYKEASDKIQLTLIELMGEISSIREERSAYIKNFGFLKLSDIEWLDEEVEHLEGLEELEQKDWALYGKTDLGSRLDFASKVCRRVERKFWETNSTEVFRPVILQYINRLSDYLYLVARYADYTL